jgi:hypothetical protein
MRVRPTISIPCQYCGDLKIKALHHHKNELKLNPDKKYFCSNLCESLFSQTVKLCICQECSISFYKRSSEIRKTPNNFCSQSCAATYNNVHKTKGIRRSKLEKWLEEQFTVLYPDLEILYSDKTTINSELDIYIPSMKLAFELNGIFHYEPIYGETKLGQIQNNDTRKFQACIERGIELCIIDTSSQKYFKDSTSRKYLDIITHLVNSKLESSKTDYEEVV